MADASSSGDVAKAIGDPLGTVLGLLARLLPEGPARTLLYVVVGLCVAAAPFIYKYYLGVLAQGAAPEGSLERQDYDKLRASLAGDNLAARLYAKWLTKFLDWIERFFGDAGMADRTLFPHAFGLKKPAPLWTAPAFDRCLLLALIYPIATIFVIWVISGNVGPAEAALGLLPNASGWSRVLLAATIGFSSFAFWRGARERGWDSRAWIVGALYGTSTGGSIAFYTEATRGPGMYIIIVSIAVTSAFAGTSTSAFAVAVAVFVFEYAVIFLDSAFFFHYRVASGSDLVLVFVELLLQLPVWAAAAFAFAIAIARALATLGAFVFKHRWHGFFLSLALPAMIMACLAAAAFPPPWVPRYLSLFLGLLTLLNAPFDWASLGLTRALLRRGLELGGWWPYLLAFVDAPARSSRFSR